MSFRSGGKELSKSTLETAMRRFKVTMTTEAVVEFDIMDFEEDPEEKEIVNEAMRQPQVVDYRIERA